MPAPRPNLSHHLIPDLPSADDILPWLRQIDANRWYTNYGPLVLEFEQQMTALIAQANPGRDFALTTLSTGYHALEFALRAFDLAPDAQVLIPAVTFPACPLAAIHAGLIPVFADINSEHWILTPETARRIAAKISVKAVMPVAVYGVPLPADAWDAFTRDTGIPVIIDAAAAIELQKIPAHCLVAHSLHATKPFGLGEGGLLIGANREQITRARILSNFGTNDRIAHDCGSNAKMSEFHAAVGLAQIARWPGIKARRAVMLEKYRAALARLPITLQPGIERATASLLMASAQSCSAGAVMAGLRTRSIATHQTYLPPLYRHPAFAGYQAVSADGKISAPGDDHDLKAKLCPQAEIMARQVFGLPFHVFMDDADIAEVARCFKQDIFNRAVN